jgi:hypothetical protein
MVGEVKNEDRDYLLRGVEKATSKNFLFYDKNNIYGLTLELICTVDSFVKLDYAYSEPDKNDIRTSRLQSTDRSDRSVKNIFLPKELFIRFSEEYEQFISSKSEKEILIGNYRVALNEFYDECLYVYKEKCKGYLWKKYLILLDCGTGCLHSMNLATCN